MPTLPPELTSARVTPAFVATLDKFELSTLEHEAGAVYALDSELRLCYFNPAWFRFAHDNQGEPAISTRFALGTSLADAISGPLQAFYLQAYRQVLDDGATWEHDYECSSAILLRRFHQKSYPLARRQGIIIINNLMIEQVHPDGDDSTPDESLYRDSHGLLTQCSHCRRVQRTTQPEHWDWVPAWVARQPPRTSHSLCQPCYDYYYRHRQRTPSAPH